MTPVLYCLIFILVATYFHLQLVMWTPVGHLKQMYVYAYLWWAIKNLGSVTFLLRDRDQAGIVTKLGYCRDTMFEPLIEFRDELFAEHGILIYYASDNEGTNFDKILAFKSPEARTIFLLRYT